jgi:hypothetical protein
MSPKYKKDFSYTTIIVLEPLVDVIHPAFAITICIFGVFILGINICALRSVSSNDYLKRG